MTHDVRYNITIMFMYNQENCNSLQYRHTRIIHQRGVPIREKGRVYSFYY